MRAPTRPAPNETESQRIARLDRDAMRTYSTRRRGGSLTKRYHQDLADITNSAPAPVAPDSTKNK